jgi:ribosome-binding protein aMBF1 (putative translation factor)
MWTKDESSIEVIERTWDINAEGSQSFKLAKKIKRVADELKSWNKNHFGYAKSGIKELEKLIEEVKWQRPDKRKSEDGSSTMFRA